MSREVEITLVFSASYLYCRIWLLNKLDLWSLITVYLHSWRVYARNTLINSFFGLARNHFRIWTAILTLSISQKLDILQTESWKRIVFVSFLSYYYLNMYLAWYRQLTHMTTWGMMDKNWFISFFMCSKRNDLG